MKLICRKVGAPTPPFTVLSGQDFVANVADEGAKRKLIQDFTKLVLDMNSAKPGLVRKYYTLTFRFSIISSTTYLPEVELQQYIKHVEFYFLVI